jgi:hypothetical protein
MIIINIETYFLRLDFQTKREVLPLWKLFSHILNTKKYHRLRDTPR